MMKKSFRMLLIFLLTFFSIPFGGLLATAEVKSYDNIKDGEYEIIAKALQADKDEKSGAAPFIKEEAVLVIDGQNILLKITVPKNEMAHINGLQIEGMEPKENIEEDGVDQKTYRLKTLKKELLAQVQYEVPMLNIEHDVFFRLVLEGLDALPVKEAEDERIDDKDSSENNFENEDGEEETDHSFRHLPDGYYVAKVSYLRSDNDDASSMGRYMGDQVFLEVKDGKVLPTIMIHENETVTKLTLDYKDPIETVVDGNSRYETFELSELLPIVQAYVEYKAPYNGSVHYGKADFRISFDGESLKQVEASDKPGAGVGEPQEIEVELGKQTPIKGGLVLTILGDARTEIVLPENISENAQVKINSVKESVQNIGNLEIAGEVYTFEFNNLGEHLDKFQLTMGYDDEKYNLEDYEIDIYYGDGKKWIRQNGRVADGKVVAEIDHFSTYGVFAKKIEKPDVEKPDVEKPKNGREMDYTIMHENGKDESLANGFFQKPAYIFEKDGKTYAQVTITNGEMIKELSSQFGQAEIVQTNTDGSIVVQFIINQDLSDTSIEMRVLVPGIYDTNHQAIFVVNKDDENPKETEKEEENDRKGRNEVEGPTLEEDVLKVEDSLKPDRLYEIDYVMKHKDGTRISVANDFFVKPALILEKDGVMYLQVTITNGEMVKGLRNQYGEALFVRKNNDGSVVYQFRINNDLSNMLLEMKIVVPGLYAEDHQAILEFNKESLSEKNVGEYVLVATGDQTNQNAPFVKGENPKKPDFGSGNNGEGFNQGTQNERTDQDKPRNLKNPQTGDETNILLYSLLLIGSMIPLSLHIRRRFI